MCCNPAMTAVEPIISMNSPGSGADPIASREGMGRDEDLLTIRRAGEQILAAGHGGDEGHEPFSASHHSLEHRQIGVDLVLADMGSEGVPLLLLVLDKLLEDVVAQGLPHQRAP